MPLLEVPPVVVIYVWLLALTNLHGQKDNKINKTITTYFFNFYHSFLPCTHK